MMTRGKRKPAQRKSPQTKPVHPKTLDLLNDAVASCHFKDFTSANVLRAFAEEGIRSLEDLAKRVVATTCHPEARPQRVSLEQMTKPTPANLLATIVHPPPKLPFYVNGVEYAPADIARFNGRALHMVVSRRGNSIELLAFEEHSTIARLTELLYMAGVSGLSLQTSASGEGGQGQVGVAFEPPSIAPPPADDLGMPGQGGQSGGGPVRVTVNVTHEIWMYEHPQPPHPWPTTGDVLRLGPMLTYADLTSVGRGFLHLGDWNDIISRLGPTYSHVVCWEHIHHQGSALVTGRFANRTTYDLNLIGWNDRISSVLNCG